jgi:hypothetical protein
MSRAAFAYAQARMQARLAKRLGPADWQVLESSHDLGHCLDMAARTGAARAVARLGGAQDVHRIEAAMRAEWEAVAGELARWLPGKWHAGVGWFTRLPLLARTEARGTPGALPAWLEEGDEFQADPRSAASAPQMWLAVWKDRLPSGADRDGLMHALGPLLARYLGTGSGAALPAAMPAPDLAGYLLKRVRAEAQSPTAIFAFLGLVALDIERLRGILAARAVFAVNGRGA